jgi:hypothetical protein
LVSFVRSLFGRPPPEDVGVREPRRPLQPTRSGAVALDPPPNGDDD